MRRKRSLWMEVRQLRGLLGLAGGDEHQQQPVDVKNEPKVAPPAAEVKTQFVFGA